MKSARCGGMGRGSGGGGRSTGYVSRKVENFQARKSGKLSRLESGSTGSWKLENGNCACQLRVNTRVVEARAKQKKTKHTWKVRERVRERLKDRERARGS